MRYVPNLFWVPSHTGAPGNEKTYELARNGAFGNFTGPDSVLGLFKSYAKRVTENGPHILMQKP